jgi:hypothetical protein
VFCRGENADELTPLLTTAINKLQENGLKILAGIGDGLAAMKKILERLEKQFPEFCGFVDYDHSFKNLRNAWCNKIMNARTSASLMHPPTHVRRLCRAYALLCRLNKKLHFKGVSVSYITLKNLVEHRDEAVRKLVVS